MKNATKTLAATAKANIELIRKTINKFFDCIEIAEAILTNKKATAEEKGLAKGHREYYKAEIKKLDAIMRDEYQNMMNYLTA